MTTAQFTTKNHVDTLTLAKRLAGNLKGHEVLALNGPLGAGKTTFCQGLAEGLGADARVTSPTFVLEKIYELPEGRRLFHYDLYRIEAADVDSIGLLDNLGQGIVVIEWAEKIRQLLSPSTIWITIDPAANDTRKFIFEYPEDLAYVTA